MILIEQHHVLHSTTTSTDSAVLPLIQFTAQLGVQCLERHTLYYMLGQFPGWTPLATPAACFSPLLVYLTFQHIPLRFIYITLSIHQHTRTSVALRHHASYQVPTLVSCDG